jgi:hypothetical protein
MMQAAIVEVIQRALSELLNGTGGKIPFEVVLLQDFGKMSEVVLSGILFEVVQHVANRRNVAAMIKRAAEVRENEYQSATGAQHPLPFKESLHGIGEVFEIVRREHKVVTGIGDRGKRGTFTEERPARWPPGAEDKLRRMVRPYGVGRKIAVVEGADLIVDGNDISLAKGITRPTDLQAGFVGNSAPVQVEMWCRLLIVVAVAAEISDGAPDQFHHRPMISQDMFRVR